MNLDELKTIATREGLALVSCPPCLGTGFDRGQERRGICESCGGTGHGWWPPSRWLTDEKLEGLVKRADGSTN
jgi:hypothetical protein